MLTVVLVIVEQTGKILLIQEAKEGCRGKWTFPGGRMEEAESVIDAATRETKEESGIDVELLGLLYVDQLLSAPYEDDVNRLRFVFTAKPIGGGLKQEVDEHSLRAGWFSALEIAALNVRSPFVEKMVALYESKPSVLSISSFHVLADEDKKLERS